MALEAPNLLPGLLVEAPSLQGAPHLLVEAPRLARLEPSERSPDQKIENECVIFSIMFNKY